MVNKKGQGISISFIVVAAIAALVLVLVVAFATGGLGKFFGSIYKVGGGTQAETDIKIDQVKCQEYCDKANLGSYGAWSGGKYCSAQFGLDVNGDGTIDSDTERFHCFDDTIGVVCSLVMTDTYGFGITCDDTDCPDAGTPDPDRECCGTGCHLDTTQGDPTSCAASAVVGAVWQQLTWNSVAGACE